MVTRTRPNVTFIRTLPALYASKRSINDIEQFWVKLVVISCSIFLFVYFSGFRKQKPKVCEWLLHTQGTPVSVSSILATCLGDFLVGKISFLPLRSPFLTNHMKSFMDSSVWGEGGGGTLKHPRFIFSSSLVQKIPRVEWYLISVYLSRWFVLELCLCDLTDQASC